MPLTTRTIQNVVDWARTQVKLVPLVGVGGFSNEPALTISNNVIQEMLSPPFNWKFNRVNAASFPTVNETYDYTSNITDFGWLESCTIEQTDSTQTLKPRFPIEVVKDLPINTPFIGNPEQIAVVNISDTDITYRISPVPGTQLWTVYPVYQKKAPIKVSLSDTWSPFPDELSFVYQQGFLAMAYKHAQDPRYPLEYQLFKAMLMEALGMKDAENQAGGFYPERPILLG